MSAMATTTTRPSGPGPDAIRDISGYPPKVPRWPRRNVARSLQLLRTRSSLERYPVIRDEDKEDLDFASSGVFFLRLAP